VTPGSAVVSPDGKHVYVEAEDRYRGGVAIFDRAAGGTITQKPGRAGCVSESLRRMCRHASGLRSARDLVVSPDGRNVYVAAASGAIAIFDRDRMSGNLTQKRGRAGCVSRPAKAGACARGRGLAHPTTIAVSADGTSVYVTSFDDEALAVFDRDPRSGALTQKRGSAGCIADEYSDAVGCRHVALDIGLEGRALTVSPDGKNVYAGTGLHIFDRRASGELTPNAAGSASTADQEVLSATVSADGKNVYATASFDGLLIFDRDPHDGALTLKPGTQGCFAAKRIEGCMRATALAAPTGASLSPDGRDLYVASAGNQGNALVILARDPSAGTLTQKPGLAGCLSQSGTGGRCAHGRGLREDNTSGEGSGLAPLVNPTLRVTVSPDGRNVYVAGDAVAVFDRR
jgi:DNA-binding beta-propeller fold protein YncE